MIHFEVRAGRLWMHGDPGDDVASTAAQLPGVRHAQVSGEWSVPATAAGVHTAVNAFPQGTRLADQGTRDLLAAYQRELVVQAAKSHTPTDQELRSMPGLMLPWLPQWRAWAFARERRFTMLNIAMGGGKSRVTVSLLDTWEEPAIILSPRAVVGVWRRELAKHSERDDWYPIIPPTNVAVAKRVVFVEQEIHKATRRGVPWAIVVNYDSAWRPGMADLLRFIAKAHRPRLVLDESHKIKAQGGKASVYCAALAKDCAGVLELTGTAMPHSPLDLYGQYRAGDPGIFGTSYRHFMKRYAVTVEREAPPAAASTSGRARKYQMVVGYRNKDEFAERFAGAAFIATKSDLGLDLPPVLHEPDIIVGGAGSAIDGPGVFDLDHRTRKAYDALDREFILGVGDGTVTAANALVKLTRLQTITSGFVRDDDGMDHVISDEKRRLLDEYLDQLPVTEPVVVFYNFTLEADRMISEVAREQGRRVGFVNGRVGPGHAEYALDEHALLRDDVDVAVVQWESGSTGVDFTRSAYCCVFSLPQKLGLYLQGIDRLDRHGQTRPVTFTYLIARDTQDEAIYRGLRSRKRVVDAVIAAARGEEIDGLPEWSDMEDETSDSWSKGE